MNGEYEYYDRKDYLFPAIRYSEPCNESIALHEKEKGDWSKLTIEEKKALYRHSFRHTFEEISAPDGNWKLYLSSMLISVGLAFWMWWGIQTFVHGKKGPIPSHSDEYMKEQLYLMLMLHNNPVQGVASKWDYEKGEWKK